MAHLNVSPYKLKFLFIPILWMQLNYIKCKYKVIQNVINDWQSWLKFSDMKIKYSIYFHNSNIYKSSQRNEEWYERIYLNHAIWTSQIDSMMNPLQELENAIDQRISIMQYRLQKRREKMLFKLWQNVAIHVTLRKNQASFILRWLQILGEW